MALFSQAQRVPILPEAFPWPSRRHEAAQAEVVNSIMGETQWFGWWAMQRMVADTSISLGAPLEIIVYLPGSGSTTLLDQNTPFVQDLLAGKMQRLFISCSFMNVTSTGSSVRPSRYSYGNVNSPHFTGSWIKYAAEAANHIGNVARYYAGMHQGTRIVLLGQSMGSSAHVAYLANMHPQSRAYFNDLHGVDGKIAGALVNAPTQAGLGDYSWNDLPRNIRGMSDMFHRLDPSIKTLISYGDADEYAPPYYTSRVRQALKPGSPHYLLSAGPGIGHNWMTTAAGRPKVRTWIDQLFDGTTITQVDGVTPAMPGPM
ncbi:hypothetical protein LO749_20805 [Paracoccus denitrificans]|uniref:hypothetical protein n=1 Tax=Paracoccus denitrificans TaxID=266 RepID=UPI001E61CABA|nr:hypothetical protein [Paracoccus denitrificans]UFS66935.1 hypothetical protein LO749_20805 [Paracoccus denitrificans]